MEAYENAKEEIEGENTVFQDTAEWWQRLLSSMRKNTVTKYSASENVLNTDDSGAFNGNVSLSMPSLVSDYAHFSHASAVACRVIRTAT